jgi:hypothetical protein
MPTELLVFIVGIAGVILGGVGHWWCWHKPAIDALREDAATAGTKLLDLEDDYELLDLKYEDTIRRLADANDRADAAEHRADTAEARAEGNAVALRGALTVQARRA